MSLELVVLSAVAAEVHKDGGQFKYGLGELWNNENEHALNFVTEVEKKFRRKSKSYAFFKKDHRKESIPTILNHLLEDSEVNFYVSAKKIMDRLKSSLNEDGRGNTQVGHVVFIHYAGELDEKDMGRLLVIMVDKKDVFDFNQNLVPTQFKSIDVDTLRQAVLYDLTLFDEVYPKTSGLKEHEAYLTLISGKSKGAFFREALGTTEIIDNTVNITSIFATIEEFGKSLKLKAPYVRKIIDEVETLIHEKKGKSISLSGVATKVIANLPESKSQYTSDDFLKFVNEKDVKISEVFDVTPGQLEKATSIEGRKGQEYFYRVKKSALGRPKDKDKAIYYDSEKRTLQFQIADEDEHKALLQALPPNKE
ncbi:nucleoid-associated protein [Alteromonas sp. R78001]|uniref:nucleoid-associated protein n=1 Tax=Alteromonas sp. R78001 TaxID=3093865 RepID=UPI003671FC08